MSRLRKNERDRAIGRFLPATRLAAQPNLPSLSSGVVSYADTDRLLQSYGIALAPAVMAQSAGEAVNDVDKLGYPCLLKVASIDIPHKTEFDALRLDLASRDAVEKAYEEMLASVRVKKPDAHIEGVLVQRQIKGVECLLGISRDEQLGPTLVMGLGGVFVDILADVQIRGSADQRRRSEAGARKFERRESVCRRLRRPARRYRRPRRHGRTAFLARPRPLPQHRRIRFESSDRAAAGPRRLRHRRADGGTLTCLVDLTLDKLLAPKAKILFAGASEAVG